MKTRRTFAFILFAVAVPIWLAACVVDATRDALKEETAAVDQAFGDPPCDAFLPDGGFNPAWPECSGGNGPTIPPPSCSGYKS